VLVSLRFEKSSITVSIPPNHPWALEPQLRSATEQRIGFAPQYRLLNRRTTARGDGHPALGIATASPPRAMYSLHRACYLACVAADAHPID